MLKKQSMLAAYAFTHFLVDFSCAFLLFGSTYNTDQKYLFFLIYNFCAFAMQMPIGLLADKLSRNSFCASAGCALIALSIGLTGIPVLTAISAGIGNALFHVGGGIDVLNVSKAKASALGIFVSPGAIGIYLGNLAGKTHVVAPSIAVSVLLLSAVVILYICRSFYSSFNSDNAPLTFGKVSGTTLIAVGCLILVVALRSYTGMLLNFPWKGQGYWGLLLVVSAAAGKAAGGFLSDWLGCRKAAVVTLLPAALFFVLSFYPPAGVFAVFLFNMTMPITLWAVASILPGAKGFSFGLLTFALFLGFSPVYLGLEPILSKPVGFGAASIISLLLLIAGLRKAAS